MGVLIAYASRDPALWDVIVVHRKYLYLALALTSLAGLWMVLGDFQLGSTQLFGLEYSFLAAIYALLLMSTLVSP